MKFAFSVVIALVGATYVGHVPALAQMTECPQDCTYSKPEGTLDYSSAVDMCCWPDGAGGFSYGVGTCSDLGKDDGTDCHSEYIDWEEDGGAICDGEVGPGGWYCPLQTVERTRHFGLQCWDLGEDMVLCIYTDTAEADVQTTVCVRCDEEDS